MKISLTSHNDNNCNSIYSIWHVINTAMLFSLTLFFLNNCVLVFYWFFCVILKKFPKNPSITQCNVEVVPNGSGPSIKPTALWRPTLLWQVLAVEMWWTTSFSTEQMYTPAMMVASSLYTTPARLVTLKSSTCSCNMGPMPTPETTGITPRCTRLPSRARSTSALVKPPSNKVDRIPSACFDEKKLY